MGFSGVPSEYEDIVVTDGYSIENDVYQDADLERLLNDKERTDHQVIINELCRWFAHQVGEFLYSRPYVANPKLEFLIRRPALTCHPDALEAYGFYEPNPALHQKIQLGYKRKLRGKLLIKALVRFLSAPDRTSKYSYANLMEIGVAFGAEGSLLNALIATIKTKLSLSLPAGNQS